MISALFYGKGGFDHVLFMVNKTLPRLVSPIWRAWKFISRSFWNGIGVRFAQNKEYRRTMSSVSIGERIKAGKPVRNILKCREF
jgi:hypothetical protein